MKLLPAFIPGFTVGFEFMWPDESDPVGAFIVHFFFFRFMFFWGIPNEQQFPTGN